MINKVGERFFDGKNKRTFLYKDVIYDENGWVDARRFLPADYDLLYLKIKDKPRRIGWSVGTKWDGLKIKKEDEILEWNKKNEGKLS